MSTRATFFGIEIGKTGLYVSQKGLDVTGHNIANVDTAGYTRQRLNNTAYDPYNGLSLLKPMDRAMVGGGAKVQLLEQIRSAFLDRQFRTEQTASSYWEVRTQGLTYVESLFESVSGQLAMTEAIQNLFTSFNTVSADPADQEQRTVLKQEAVKLCEQFNHMYQSLIDLQKGQDTAVKTVTEHSNTMAGQIADLNKAIYAFEIDGMPANDLRDKRNLLIDQLSAIVDIEYTGDAIGSKCQIKVAGEILVDHKKVNALEVGKVPNPLGTSEEPVWEVRWSARPDDVPPFPLTALNLDPATGGLTGGELLAHIKLRDGTEQNEPGIPYYINQLNNLARAMVQNINAIHREGYTHPAGGASVQGVNFFQEEAVYNTPGDPTSGIDYYDVSSITAGNIRISDALKDSVYNIAASTTKITLGPPPEELQIGNNENMLKLFALSHTPNLMLTGVPGGPIAIGDFESFVSSITLDVATSLGHSKHKGNTSYSLLLGADTQRLSISGVSLDEEMTQLIKYNHAYSGASRVITAMDEALDVLINRTGRVGL